MAEVCALSVSLHSVTCRHFVFYSSTLLVFVSCLPQSWHRVLSTACPMWPLSAYVVVLTFLLCLALEHIDSQPFLVCQRCIFAHNNLLCVDGKHVKLRRTVWLRWRHLRDPCASAVLCWFPTAHDPLSVDIIFCEISGSSRQYGSVTWLTYNGWSSQVVMELT